MMLMFILTVFLLIALVGSLPIWPHSRKWGYIPIGGIGAVAVIATIVILFFARHGGQH
jgi:hypothetical protein